MGIKLGHDKGHNKRGLFFKNLRLFIIIFILFTFCENPKLEKRLIYLKQI